MRLTRSLAPKAASLVLLVTLAACAPGATDAPSPTPAPTTQPPAESPTSSPSPSPSESPSATPGEVVELELPMIARATEDGVDVYARPSTDAPPLTGEQFPDMNRVDIILAAD